MFTGQTVKPIYKVMALTFHPFPIYQSLDFKFSVYAIFWLQTISFGTFQKFFRLLIILSKYIFN